MASKKLRHSPWKVVERREEGEGQIDERRVRHTPTIQGCCMSSSEVIRWFLSQRKQPSKKLTNRGSLQPMATAMSLVPGQCFLPHEFGTILGLLLLSARHKAHKCMNCARRRSMLCSTCIVPQTIQRSSTKYTDDVLLQETGCFQVILVSNCQK